MNLSYWARYALGVCGAVGVLAGCSSSGGSQSALVPSGTQSTQQTVVQPDGRTPPQPQLISRTTRDGFVPSGQTDKESVADRSFGEGESSLRLGSQ